MGSRIQSIDCTGCVRLCAQECIIFSSVLCHAALCYLRSCGGMRLRLLLHQQHKAWHLNSCSLHCLRHSSNNKSGSRSLV